MTTKTRIYTIATGEKTRLVRASHPNNALMHAAREMFSVRVATQDDLENLISVGVKVEAAAVEANEMLESLTSKATESTT